MSGVLCNHGYGAFTTGSFAVICPFFLENSSGLFCPSLPLLATSFPAGCGAQPGCSASSEQTPIRSSVSCARDAPLGPSWPCTCSPAFHECLTHPVSCFCCSVPGPFMTDCHCNCVKVKILSCLLRVCACMCMLCACMCMCAHVCGCICVLCDVCTSVRVCASVHGVLWCLHVLVCAHMHAHMCASKHIYVCMCICAH